MSKNNGVESNYTKTVFKVALCALTMWKWLIGEDDFDQ